MKKFFINFLVMSFIAVTACSSMKEGKMLFEAKCGECHELEKALKETKSLAEWKKTNKAMIRYSDGAITEKDAKIIAKYLAGRSNN